jgi:addiction module HigA family antidote
MVQKSKRHPSIEPHHPGEALREDHLPALGISKAAFARALGVSRQTVYDLLDERYSLTAEMAVRLEAVVGGSAEMWLNVQMAHDLWHARRNVDVSQLRRLRAPEDEDAESSVA